jgi:hypothetical protein
MAAGHDSTTVDEEGPHEDPGEGEPVGGYDAPEDHDDHGHDAHGHDDHGHDGHDDHDDHGAHGEADDKWVLLPLIAGLVIGLAVALYFGLGSAVSEFG